MSNSEKNRKYLKSVYGSGTPIKCLEEQIQILSNIFDEKNKKICSECNSNYRDVPSHHYEIVNGKRKRIYTNRTRLPENECCGARNARRFQGPEICGFRRPGGWSRC